MKLTDISANTRGVVAELIVQLEGNQYEAVRIGIGAQAVDVADQLRRLSARISARATAAAPTSKDQQEKSK